MYEYIDWSAYQDALYHHGIFGMKWGIRRYQNPDGSLTEAGRKRYGVDGGKPGGESESVKTKPKLSKSDIEGMSDDDLRKLVQRTELEKRYEQLTKEPEVKKELTNTQKAINYVSDYGGKVLKVATSAIALAKAYQIYQESYGNKAKAKATNNDIEALKKKIEELQLAKNSQQETSIVNEVKNLAQGITKTVKSQSVPNSQAVAFGKEMVKAVSRMPANSVISSSSSKTTGPITMYTLGGTLKGNLKQIPFSDFMSKYGEAKITSSPKGLTTRYDLTVVKPKKR